MIFYTLALIKNFMIQELNLNFFNILIIAGIIQGIIFGLTILLSKHNKSISNKYLAQIVIYLSLNNLYYWFVDTNLSSNYKYYEYIYIPWNLLILPMYYFFVITYLKYDLRKKEQLYLIIPFITSLTIHGLLLTQIFFLIDYFKTPIYIKHFFYYTEEYFSIVFTVYLIYKTFRIINKYKIENTKFSITNVPISTKWLKQLLYFGLLICSFWLIIIIYNQYNANNLFENNNKYFLWISVSILIYWLGYLGVYHSSVFLERQQIRKQNISPSKKHNLNYSRFEEIDIAIRNDKLYLNPNLSLDILAESYNISSGYLSQLTNEFTKSNFSNYINELRVNRAKEMLIDNEYNNYTIIAIALESGFNSKSAFYNAFKREVKISPSKYKVKNNVLFS